MTPIQNRSVSARKGQAEKNSERSPTPPQHEDIQFTIEVTNNAAAARQDLNKTGNREKYSQTQHVNRTENQCRKNQDMLRGRSEGTNKYPLRNGNGVRSPSQSDLLNPISNYKKSQRETNISRPEEKVYLSRPEPKEWINSVKAKSIKVDSTILGVKYYGDNTYGEHKMINLHQHSQYENAYIRNQHFRDNDATWLFF